MSEWRDIYGGKNAADDQKREQSIEPFGSHQRSVATSLFVCTVSTSMAPVGLSDRARSTSHSKCFLSIAVL